MLFSKLRPKLIELQSKFHRNQLLDLQESLYYIFCDTEAGQKLAFKQINTREYFSMILSPDKLDEEPFKMVSI